MSLFLSVCVLFLHLMGSSKGIRDRPLNPFELKIYKIGLIKKMNSDFMQNFLKREIIINNSSFWTEIWRKIKSFTIVQNDDKSNCRVHLDNPFGWRLSHDTSGFYGKWPWVWDCVDPRSMLTKEGNKANLFKELKRCVDFTLQNKSKNRLTIVTLYSTSKREILSNSLW